jgi:putative FmdB family regulatory protein
LKCRDEFEAMQKFSDTPLKKCPSCGGAVKRLISRSSFQLKGSGWYLTDYAKNTSPKETTENKTDSDTSSESTPSSTKSESSDD